MNIRSAQKSDISFIVDAIMEIEKRADANTYSNLFSVDHETAKNYLHRFFLDQENLGTELSLNTFIIAEINGEQAGCSALIFTDHDYYISKSEVFPIHLKTEDLQQFLENARMLPDHKKESQKKYFVEYVFVNEKFRGKGIAAKMIEYHIAKIADLEIFINVFENNEGAYKTYKKLGFSDFQKIKIDTVENKIYPAEYKIMMSRKI